MLVTLGRDRFAPLPSHVGEDTPLRGFTHDPVEDAAVICLSEFLSAFLEDFLRSHSGSLLWGKFISGICVGILCRAGQHSQGAGRDSGTVGGGGTVKTIGNTTSPAPQHESPGRPNGNYQPHWSAVDSSAYRSTLPT